MAIHLRNEILGKFCQNLVICSTQLGSPAHLLLDIHIHHTCQFVGDPDQEMCLHTLRFINIKSIYMQICFSPRPFSSLLCSKFLVQPCSYLETSSLVWKPSSLTCYKQRAHFMFASLSGVQNNSHSGNGVEFKRNTGASWPLVFQLICDCANNRGLLLHLALLIVEIKEVARGNPT